jgi:hypothetical protein
MSDFFKEYNSLSEDEKYIVNYSDPKGIGVLRIE